jgi:predicted HNH restriction endonuclease
MARSKDEANAYNRKRYQESAEVRARAKAASYSWRERHPEQHRETARAWYEANRQRALESGKAYRDRNPELGRAKHLKRTYGMTTEEYDTMLNAQGGRCAICGESPLRRRLHVDHDHETGRVRGLLCSRCNTALEWGAAYGEKARAYLDEHAS